MTITPTAHDDLVAALDLPAKVRLLTGATTFTLAAQESIGLGEMRLSDGPTGVRGLKFSGGPVVALLPNATLLASTWSEDATYEAGRILAEEALAQQIHVVLGPTINLHRSTLGGRLFEAYSEDPLLSGRLAASYVRGLQDLGVGACLKHLIANESETERNTVNSVVDETTLRELYLLPFEIAVEAGPWSMMAAYNDVNGVPATEQHHVVNEVVKGEWGYDGVVMSDWFATKTAAEAANGGLDLVMPGPAGPWGDSLVAAVGSGVVDESVIDDHLRRLLLMADRAGALGTLRGYPESMPAPDCPERSEQLRRLAAGGMTVLTNTGALPLADAGRVALIGRHAIETIDMGGGSAQVNPPYQVSVAEGLTALLGSGLPTSTLTVTDGVEVRTRPLAAGPGFVTDPSTGRPGALIRLFAADGSLIREVHQQTAEILAGFDDDFAEKVSRIVITAEIGSAGAIELGAMGPGDWTVRDPSGAEHTFALRTSGTGLGEEMLAPPVATTIVEAVGSGGAGSGVVEAEVRLLGSGPDLLEDDGPLTGVGRFALIARPAPVEATVVIAAAVEAASEADVAVVVVGLTDEQETEAVDKTTLRLPGEQDAMVAAVARVARRTVVVVNAATPVLMPWLADVDAVLWAGLPGQEGGHAIAAALTGAIEPAGRLVTTFPAADGAAPAWSVTPVDGDLEYHEGTFIGYRGHHAGRAPAPAFWFGHGLGYSRWSYSGAEVVTGDGTAAVRVAVSVTNTGERRSREVVQLYWQPEDPGQPVRLVGWSAITLEAGAAAEVEVAGDPLMWRRWDAPSGTWATLPATGELLVARGLGDVRLRLPLA